MINQLDHKRTHAAIRIQQWWKRVSSQRRQLIEKATKIKDWKGLERISLDNTLLIERLEELRRAKSIDKMKYEVLMRLPAREVNGFLENENKVMRNAIDKSELLELSVEQEYETHERDRAARIIQRNIRSFCLRRRSSHFSSQIENIPLKRRIKLLAELSRRLNDQTTRRRVNLEHVKTTLALHKDDRQKHATEMARRELLIQRLNRHFAVLSGLPADRSIPLSKEVQKSLHAEHFQEYKAENTHKRDMAILEDKIMGI